ncbi:hypothetical protein FHX37_0202 [Haloactinospora alba]|uniref:Uncharacterized protein n=1 Tax=Haloactinospora alba TaxID=405555 RepID=A0A543NEU0_9ACTN|nr:hypothetical protein FHX37_0202 [Haloactinospora alba]
MARGDMVPRVLCASAHGEGPGIEGFGDEDAARRSAAARVRVSVPGRHPEAVGFLEEPSGGETPISGAASPLAGMPGSVCVGSNRGWPLPATGCCLFRARGRDVDGYPPEAWRISMGTRGGADG